MRAKWSKPRPIDKIDAPPKPGIYIILNLKPVRRIGGIDPKGILYVGESRNLQNRLWRFWDANHPASGLLWDHPQIAQNYLGKRCSSQDAVGNLLGKLYVKITPLASKELDKAERAVLFAYVYKFGEPPPLNFNLPGHWEEKPDKKELQWAKRVII
jgi:hypothetical protein